MEHIGTKDEMTGGMGGLKASKTANKFMKGDKTASLFLKGQ